MKNSCAAPGLIEKLPLGAMSDLAPKAILSADYGSYKGYVAENFAAQEFLSYGRDKLFSWQEGKFELEFLLTVDTEMIPIEIKSGNSLKSKRLSAFGEKYHPPYRVIFSRQPSDIRGRTHNYPLYMAGQFPFFTNESASQRQKEPPP